VSLCAGEKINLTIQDIAFGGEGIGRLNDLVVFVPFVAVGEVIECELLEVKKRFARARLLRVIHSANARVEPHCPYFGECGGCQYQHLAYDEQLRMKHKQVQDIFERIGGFSPAIIQPVIPCPNPYGYRNRIMIRSQWDKIKKGLNLGFIKADNRLVVDIEECKIAEPAINSQIQQVRLNPPPKGGLKVVLRIPPEGWQVPRDSFFQNNFFLLPGLVQIVRKCLEAARSTHLIDVYCGVGFFSLELADLVQSYAGIELDQLAIKAARQNAILRGRTNGEFVAGAAEDLLPGLIKNFVAEQTTVLVDPPRKGCPSGILELLRQVRPSQLIYVSCHPATMARDLNVLCQNGVFSLAGVFPLDMFPQTAHLESVANLRANA